MKNWTTIVAGCAFLGGAYSAAATGPAPSDVPIGRQCRTDSGVRACSLWIATDLLSIKDAPSDAATELERIANSFGAATGSFERTDLPISRKWIAVPAFTKDRRAIRTGWVLHSDVVTLHDLKQVKGCWPVMNLPKLEHSFDDGSSLSVDLTMTMDGAVFDRNLDPTNKAFGALYPTKYHIYYGRGIFKIWQRDENDGDLVMPVRDWKPGDGVVSADSVTGVLVDGGRRAYLVNGSGARISEDLEMRPLPASCKAGPRTSSR